MKWYLIVLVFISLLGASTLAYQVFKMTELDAKSRGFKHPKAWGFFALGGNNNSGLLLYLIGRKKYLSNMNAVDKQIIESRKNKAGVSLIFFALSTIALFAVFVLEF